MYLRNKSIKRLWNFIRHLMFKLLYILSVFISFSSGMFVNHSCIWACALFLSRSNHSCIWNSPLDQSVIRRAISTHWSVIKAACLVILLLDIIVNHSIVSLESVVGFLTQLPILFYCISICFQVTSALPFIY